MEPQSSSKPEETSDWKLAYLVLRLSLGLNIFMHGLVRMPRLNGFADGMVKQFGNTVLPAVVVRPFALVLVFVEAIVGLLVLLGLWTREALVVGATVMAALIFGTALRSEWETVAIQLTYAAIYAALIAARSYNAYSVDALLRR
jgi:thiosulfate dehydrogenase (quinone) large subunit